MKRRSPVFRHALSPALLALALSLAGCGSDRLSGLGLPGLGSTAPAPAAVPTAPPINMAGRWLFSSPGRGQCYMNFGAASPAAAEGTIAPEGGCPGKFYMSRKWSYDQNGLAIRDHKGQQLALLSAAGNRFDGQASSGEPVVLSR